MVQENLLKYLPEPQLWPQLFYGHPLVEPPEKINVGYDMFSKVVESGWENKIAVIEQERLVTFSDLIKHSNQVANYLLENIGEKEPSERVIIRIPNSVEFIEAVVGTYKAGKIMTLTFFGLKAHEIEYIINQTEARIAFVGKPFLEDILKALKNTPSMEHIIVVGDTSDLPKTIDNVKIHTYDEILKTCKTTPTKQPLFRQDDIAAIWYTSGVTGRPKGCVMFQGSLYALNRIYTNMPFNPKPDDRVMGPVPWSFAWGYVMCMCLPLFNGATLIVMPLGQRDPETIAAMIEKYKVTIFTAVPTFYYRMLQAEVDKKYDLSSLRLCKSAGALLREELWDEVEKRFKVRLYNCYGTTETHGLLWSWSDILKRKFVPVPGTKCMTFSKDGKRLRIGEPGLIAILGIGGALYWREPEKQKETVINGWTVMSDIAVEDKDGGFRILGRADDMIKVSGALVSPDEVEQVILRHPIVSEVAVVGKPDPERGQIVKGFIVPVRKLTPDEEEKIKEEIITLTKNELPSYKVPREIVFIEALPKTTSGKVIRREL